MDNSARFRFSSITRKVVMALAGLFLVTFLLVHMSINLLLLIDDGGRSFSAAAAFMGTNPLIRVFEVVLFGGFLLHIVFGVTVSFMNRFARPIRYKHRSLSETSFFSRYMFHTGIIVFVFLVLHFIDFYFVKVGLVTPPAGVDRHDFYRMSILLFSSPQYSIIYILFIIILGFHLNHAIQAGFQTLGLNHNKYIGTVRMVSSAYAVLVTCGFIAIPVFFILFR